MEHHDQSQIGTRTLGSGTLRIAQIGIECGLHGSSDFSEYVKQHLIQHSALFTRRHGALITHPHPRFQVDESVAPSVVRQDHAVGYAAGGGAV